VLLLHYGRAELKTSDHRPVGAQFEFLVRRVDPAQRRRVYEEVIGSMGPPDGTVLVSIVGCPDAFPGDRVDAVLGKLQELGIHPIIVKFDRADMWLIFENGESALAALSMHGVCVGGGCVVDVRLRTPDWTDTALLALPEDGDVQDENEDDDLPISATVMDDRLDFDSDEDEAIEQPIVHLPAASPAPSPIPPRRPPPPRSSTPVQPPENSLCLPLSAAWGNGDAAMPIASPSSCAFESDFVSR